MKICIVAEGSYPYVVGGVSSWVNSMIKSFPNVEFCLLTIITDRSSSGVFKYELPDNVTEVYEAYLNDLDWGRKPKDGRRTRLKKKQHEALQSLVLNREVQWEEIFDFFQNTKYSIDDLLMGANFLDIVKDSFRERYPQIVFSDYLWTLRSIYMPLFLLLKTQIPKADIYHCVSTGYAGILGSMAKHLYNSSLVVSEHGIYTREREEEILRSDWVQGVYKNLWIEQFRKMSLRTYQDANVVTCLFSRARELQIGLGCPEQKIMITPNGIDIDGFAGIPGKTQEDQGFINVGAVLRVTPIKDVKTLIRSFAYAKEKVGNLKLWIMGPADEDEEYAAECQKLVDDMQLRDVIFTGRINVKNYLGRMDFTILTSISEGQPLTILEGYAAKKPVISTDVGCCRELIYGEDDGIGSSGIVTHIMNVPELAEAMITMAESEKMRLQMGENGYERLKTGYTIQQMVKTYKSIYESARGVVFASQD